MAVGFPTKSNWSAGDVLTASGMDDLAGTLNYLSPVGQANGSTLVANSANASGLGWQPLNAAGKNAIINGGMDIWQRGTSVSVAASTAAYTADRLSISTAASQASTVSRQPTGDTTNLPNIQYCARVQRNSGQTGTGTMYVANSIETTNSIPYTGKTVTVSFYARAGANYSATSNALGLYLWNGTGTDQNVNGGYTGANIVGSVTATLTTTWQRFTFTGTVPTNSTELALQFQNVPTGTAGANDYYEVTGIQLELGSVATTFSRAGGTLQGELAACQRYYWRTGGNNVYSIFGFGQALSTTICSVYMKTPVSMRVAPTSIDTTTLSNYRWYNGNSGSITSLFLDGSTTSDILMIDFQGTFTAQVALALQANNTTSAYIGFSAEL